MDIWKELKQEGVDPGLLEEVRAFRDAHPAPPEAAGRVPRPRFLYYGKEVWEGAVAALLCGEHLLLAGPKATGKNVLAENLAAAFGRPAWDVSMYVNVDAAALIGADTLQDGQVAFREGPVCQCARLGGFGVLDEVNMAKNEALDLRGLLSALHLMEKGISSGQALELGIINKAFDPFERQLVADAVWSRVPRDADRGRLFGV